MKNIFVVLFFTTLVFAKVTNIPATIGFINSTKMKIIDIRTKDEWQEIGVIKGSYPITFFDERYGYDKKSFLKELNKVVDKNEKFAIISNSGSRSKLVANFLGVKNSYHVINLKGGMKSLLNQGFIPSYYNPYLKGGGLVLKLTDPTPEMLEREEARLNSRSKDKNITK